MKKIAILTINSYINFGNVLQNFATQEILNSLGFEVETIIHNATAKKAKQTLTRQSLIRRISNFINLSNLDKFERLKIDINKYLYNLDNKKVEIFSNFKKKYINETPFSISEDNIPPDLGNRYDFFVTGSDQVWNPEKSPKCGYPINFIIFAPKHKRIAYAPSFGINKIPSEYVENYKLWLKEMKSLSVREEAGAKIIKELTGRDATVLIDPTLVLSKEHWLSISKPAVNKPIKPYLLTYFFGIIPVEIKKEISKIAIENNLDIISLNDYNNKSTFAIDPFEFLNYINSSSFILTNSFHGTLFSILFKKPFVVFDVSWGVNSRIDTLLSTFKLENRRWGSAEFNRNINVDYTHINDILEKERKKTFNYLKNSLEVN